MRELYPPLFEGLKISLRDIFDEGFPADKVIQRRLKAQQRWGSRDRRLFAEAVYDIVRWWRRLLFAVEVPWPEDDRWTQTGDEILCRVIGAWCLLHDVELGRGTSRYGMTAERVLRIWNDPSLPRSVRQSIPDWLDTWGFTQLGERWEAVISVLNETAPVYLRVNRLKVVPEKLVANLKSENIQARLKDGDTVQLEKRANVFMTASFRAGHFEVQDLNSQAVALALAAEPGERVIDACAGAGGKSLHLASLMNNKGRIVSMDVVAKKLDQLRERATRAGATCIEVRAIDSTKVIKRLADGADRVLLDVPCSGLGVLRRNPDGKWKLSLEEVERLKGLQRQILGGYSQMCKPGGVLVYATCSIMPEENEHQVEGFLSQNGTAWSLESQCTLMPESGGGDGFFIARLRRMS
jgi:16S rRNA (cytosine967-C5)-methyltransferase